MSLQTIEGYFKSNIFKPFYMVVGDDEYRFLKAKLIESGDVEFVRLSNCCRNADKKPDMDKFREILRMADVDCDTNRIVVLGLGEYLALEGHDFSNKVLNELISFNLGTAHAVFLLRGVDSEVKAMLNSDPRLSGRQIEMGGDTNSSLSFMFSSYDLGMYKENGFKSALIAAEDGDLDVIRANSSIRFYDSIYSVQYIKNPYEAICKKERGFNLPKSLGPEDYWEELLKEINKAGSLLKVYDSHRFDTSLGDFYEMISGNEYPNWLYYLYLVKNKNNLSNKYLKYVLDKSVGFDDFKYKVLNAISEISCKAESFKDYYADRKRLVSQYPDADVAVFVANNRFNPEESIFKLTDNTLVEREEIIADIAQHGIPQGLEFIYPALSMYLKKYHFNGDAINNLLTEYFDDYKQQKVTNTLSEDFLQKVDQLALSRDYNRLRTRDELVTNIGTEGTFLCWIDALGVEYLGYIVELAQKRGLAVSVNVGRAELPTITGINKKFYDTWPNEQKRKIEDLDDTKHNDKGGYKYGPSNLYSIHLAKELQIIANAVDEAAIDLGLHRYERYIIASDHGASRLAVLRKKEEKYNTDTQGEHSGRCCKVFSNYDLPFATEENGYIVLADYGRFKGSRAANVEVHGGASLEEVVVPVISLSLRDTSIVIKLVETTVKADYKTGATFTLFVNKQVSQTLSVDYQGKRYACEANDSNHYRVTIDSIKRAGTFPVDVYLGEDLVSHITVKAVGKSASMNSDFDDLF